jgi:hypothetical protein
MRYSAVLVLATLLTGAASAQPAPKPADGPKKHGALFWQGWPASGWLPADDPNMIGAYFKLEVLGWLSISGHIDADPKALQVYSRDTGVDIGPAPGSNLARSFELFLGGDTELVSAAKQLKQKWVVVEGDLTIVHGPVQLLFGGHGSESLGRTEYSHPPPRYVIKVRRLAAAPAGVPNVKQEPYIKIEVRGVLDTLGKNPTLRDMSANKDSPGTVIRTDQCNIYLYLGKDDKWLARAKELNGKAAVARGELIDVGREAPDMKTRTKPFGVVAPLPLYLLNVSDLQPAPGTSDKERKKE